MGKETKIEDIQGRPDVGSRYIYLITNETDRIVESAWSNFEEAKKECKQCSKMNPKKSFMVVELPILDRMSDEGQNSSPNALLAAVPIVSSHLEEKYGFECKVDYDKDFATDNFYSLKIVTYKKKIVGNLEIHITDTFNFVEAPDAYKYHSTTVEIVQGTEFQEIKIDKMWQLLMLIDMLQGV